MVPLTSETTKVPKGFGRKHKYYSKTRKPNKSGSSIVDIYSSINSDKKKKKNSNLHKETKHCVYKSHP